MGCAVGVPNPIVGVEGGAVVLVYLAVEGAEVTSVLAHADRALKGAVVGRVEYGLLVFRSSLHVDACKRLVPYVTTFGSQSRHVIVGLFAVEVVLGLFGTDERNAVAEVHLLGAIGKAPNGTGVSALGILLAFLHLALFQDAGLNGSLFGFDVEVNLGVVAQVLISADGLGIGVHFAVAGVDHHVDGLVGLTELYVVDGRLMGQGVLGCHVVVVQLNLERVGGNLLVVVGVRTHGSEFLALIGSEVEGRAFAVVCHDDGQSVHTLRCVVAPVGIHAQHAVGQLHGGEGGHEQVADVPNVGVHIVHIVLLNLLVAGR